MNVVDSSGWLEYLADGPGADFFAPALAARLGKENKLPLADSVVLATARLYGAVVWTQDSDFEGLEGVRYMPKKKQAAPPSA